MRSIWWLTTHTALKTPGAWGSLGISKSSSGEDLQSRFADAWGRAARVRQRSTHFWRMCFALSSSMIRSTTRTLTTRIQFTTHFAGRLSDSGHPRSRSVSTWSLRWMRSNLSILYLDLVSTSRERPSPTVALCGQMASNHSGPTLWSRSRLEWAWHPWCTQDKSSHSGTSSQTSVVCMICC